MKFHPPLALKDRVRFKVGISMVEGDVYDMRATELVVVEDEDGRPFGLREWRIDPRDFEQIEFTRLRCADPMSRCDAPKPPFPWETVIR